MIDMEFKSNYCKEFMYGHVGVIIMVVALNIYLGHQYIYEYQYIKHIIKYPYAFAILVVMPMGVFSFINSAYHQAKSHTQVTIEENGIEGLSIFGKKTFLKFDEIVKIHKPKWTGMDLISIVDTHNQEIRILGTMSHFGFLLEYVRDHSPNIKHVDFGGLDDEPSIWRNDRPFYS